MTSSTDADVGKITSLQAQSDSGPKEAQSEESETTSSKIPVDTTSSADVITRTSAADVDTRTSATDVDVRTSSADVNTMASSTNVDTRTSSSEISSEDDSLVMIEKASSTDRPQTSFAAFEETNRDNIALSSQPDPASQIAPVRFGSESQTVSQDPLEESDRENINGLSQQGPASEIASVRFGSGAQTVSQDPLEDNSNYHELKTPVTEKTHIPRVSTASRDSDENAPLTEFLVDTRASNVPITSSAPVGLKARPSSGFTLESFKLGNVIE